MQNNQRLIETFSEKSFNKKKRPKKRPRRLENPGEMYKYFISRTSLHGIKYSQDAELYKVERFIWLLLVIAGFYCAVKVIIQLYDKFHAKDTNIIIDEINYDIFHIPFPSVTVCPGSRVDWNEVTKLANSLIPETNQEARESFFELFLKFSRLSFSHLYEFDLKSSAQALDILNQINITDVLMKVMPKCEEFIFNCTWSFLDTDCCDIFEVQKTDHGFCYTFNSLTSVEQKLKKAHKTHGYGFRSGLKFIIKKDNLHNPPNVIENHGSIIMISNPKIYPAKGRYMTYGKRYNIDIKFSSAYASHEVLELEDTENPPCKNENGIYKFENCLTQCQQKYVHKKCGCNPTFLFPFAAGVRECNATDLQCLGEESEQISEVHYSLASNLPHMIKAMCNCPPECEYCSYDDFVIGVPYYEPNCTYLDVHYDGPTGVRYKRDIVVSDLDMLVQLGGIFGLFLGGSVLTVIEIVYCFVIGFIFYIYRGLTCSERKPDVKLQQVIEVLPNSQKKIYPLLDFPVALKANKPRY